MAFWYGKLITVENIKNRFRAMKTRQAKDWWTASFGDPLSWLFLSILGDWKWVTPNGLTYLSLFIRLGGAGVIAFGNGIELIWGIVLIQFGMIMDHMDGNLARYRKSTSITGGFIDRIFDGISFYVILSALGWLAVRQGSPQYILFLASTAGVFYLLICYIYWSYAYYELKYKGESINLNPGAIESNLAEVPTWKIILNGQKLIFKFHHIDFYFWISLSILIGKPEWGVWFHFIILLINFQQRFKLRLKRMSKFG